MVKKNIIFLEKNMVSLIRHKGDKIEFIKKDGETDFEVSDNFWKWWKEAVSYLPDDETDLCFIYDKDYELLHDDFLNEVKKVEFKDSVWNINYIRSFFWELKPTYFNVCLVDRADREIYLSGNEGKSVSVKKFYTNMEFDGASIFSCELKDDGEIQNGNENVEKIDESEISDIAKYFVDLIRKERGYN